MQVVCKYCHILPFHYFPKTLYVHVTVPVYVRIHTVGDVVQVVRVELHCELFFEVVHLD